MNLEVSEIITKWLKINGVKILFGVPGSNVSLYYYAKKHNILPIITKHENTSFFAAEGYYKTGGIKSAVFCSLGPGILNGTTGIVSTKYEYVPTIIISGQVPKKSFGNNAFEETSGVNGKMNQYKTISELVKKSVKIHDTKNLFKKLNLLTKALNHFPFGPVYLEISTDVMKKNICYSSKCFTKSKVNPSKLSLEIKSKINLVSSLIKNSKLPILLIGNGIKLFKAQKGANILAKKLNSIIVTSIKGKGIIDEYNKNHFGVMGISTSPKIKEIIKKSDLIICVGASLSEFTTDKSQLLQNKKIIFIGLKNANRPKNIIPHICLNGDLKQILSKLNNKLPKNLHFDIPKISLDVKKKGRIMSPKDFFVEFSKFLPKESVVCTEAIIQTSNALKLRSLNYITSSNLASIGCAIGNSIGAKLANPKATVFCIQGDFGFQMYASELHTAKIYKLPIITILLNNKTCSTIRDYELKTFGKPVVSDIVNPKFRFIADGLGAKYFSIKKLANVKRVTQEAIKQNKKGHCVLVDVTLNKELW